MERVIGIRFHADPTAESIALCSERSAALSSVLLSGSGVTFNQILYPYADALSLSGRPGTESTRIFGTHMLLRNLAPERIEDVMQKHFTGESGHNAPITHTIEEFSLTDGAARSSDVAMFLRAGAECSLPWVGDFARMLGGYVPHWRIRECARIFASFSEMAYRRSGGAVIGLCGGRLVYRPECSCGDALAEIFSQKTGV